jgi:hypothetical protein
MTQKIKAREIRLLFAVGALFIFAVASTHPGGGLTCCGALEPDIVVTVINKYMDNQGFGFLPNVGYAIIDTKSSDEGGTKKIKKSLYVDGTATHTLPPGMYVLLAFEIDLDLSPGKSVYQTVIIADATITIY